MATTLFIPNLVKMIEQIKQKKYPSLDYSEIEAAVLSEISEFIKLAKRHRAELANLEDNCAEFCEKGENFVYSMGKLGNKAFSTINAECNGDLKTFQRQYCNKCSRIISYSREGEPKSEDQLAEETEMEDELETFITSIEERYAITITLPFDFFIWWQIQAINDWFKSKWEFDWVHEVFWAMILGNFQTKLYYFTNAGGYSATWPHHLIPFLKFKRFIKNETQFSHLIVDSGINKIENDEYPYISEYPTCFDQMGAGCYFIIPDYPAFKMSITQHECIEKTWRNIERMWNHPRAIVPVQFLTGDMASFIENYQRGYALGVDRLAIGNLKSSKDIGFLNQITTYIITHNPRNIWIHFLGLRKEAIIYLLKQDVKFPISVDSLSWDYQKHKQDNDPRTNKADYRWNVGFLHEMMGVVKLAETARDDGFVLDRKKNPSKQTKIDFFMKEQERTMNETISTQKIKTILEEIGLWGVVDSWVKDSIADNIFNIPLIMNAERLLKNKGIDEKTTIITAIRAIHPLILELINLRCKKVDMIKSENVIRKETKMLIKT